MSAAITVVVGNPKPRSRTWEAAHRIADGLSPTSVDAFDLADFGPALLDWNDADVTAAVKRVAASDIAVIATPTFKATYTGLLKLFLDRFAGGTGLAGVVAVPVQLGAGLAHALSPELHLRPLLSELGATVPAPALYLLDSAEQPDPWEIDWLDRWSPVIRAATSVGRPALR